MTMTTTTTKITTPTMIDWLRPAATETPTVDCGTRRLPIAIRRRADARRMTLRLAPDGSEARVTVPQWGRSAEAVAFVRSRAAWLAQQLAAIPEAAPPAAGASLTYRGQALTIVHAPALPRRPRVTGAEIHVGGPANTLSARLQRWLETEARRLIGADLTEYCARAGLSAPDLALSRAQRRWGSCASSGTIRINWRLVMAPDAVRRSVVAHEVAHLLHFDHSPSFHAALAGLFEGDIGEANRWLRTHGRGLYAAFG
jgi:predicted metal-dependent hydrolase